MVKLSPKESAFCREHDPLRKAQAAVVAFFSKETSLEERWMLKLYALRELAKWEGMIGPHRTDPPLKNNAVCEKAITVITSPDKPLYSKMAASCLLDYYEPEWKSNYPKEIIGYIAQRNDPEVAEWRKVVLSRDGYKCRKCGSVEKIEAHHLLRWIDFPHARLLPENGITLCRACHHDAHHGNA